MSDAMSSNPDLAALQMDLAALKRDVAGLVAHLKAGVSNTTQNAAATAEDGARQLYRSLAAEGEKSVKAISQQVEEQPVMALLIAFGVGCLGGRLLSR